MHRTLPDLRHEPAPELAGGRVTPVFQRIVHLPRHEVCGYEMLARFPGSSLPVPDVFAAAGRAGTLGRLEATVVRLGLHARRLLPRNCFLTVNVSAAGLLAEEVQDALHGERLDRIVLELTEHAPEEDEAALSATLRRLRDQGASVAVDDAGTGYASLARVMAVRPEFVKLDRDAIAGIDRDPARQALVEAVGELAGRLDAYLVAEGVERAEEREALVRLGVPLAQGFLLGRPARRMLAGPLAWPRPRRPPHARALTRLAVPAPAVRAREAARALAELDPGAHVAVVDARGRPVGLLAPGDDPALPRPALRAQGQEDAAAVARRAMARAPAARFDPVICCDERGRYVGLVPVDALVGDLCGRVQGHERQERE